ncbi:MAG: hypothetical protein ABI680_15550 [Chthoniobacteraceae bacterium]
MSDHSHATVPEAEKFDPAKLGGLSKYLLVAGAIGIVASLIGAIFSTTQFAYSWLFGFTYFFTLCVGSLFWTCIHHATDAEWSVVVRRQLENVAALIPYLFVLFIPLFFCFGTLLHWWHLTPGENPIYDEKSGYLNHGFFYFRVAFYFIMLSWVAWSLRRHSTQQDSDGAARHTFSMRRFGIGGIPVVALCLTFAAIDWLMGLDYHWFSTMWGVYIFAGAVGGGMALLVLIVHLLQGQGYLKVVNEEHYHVMGKWMLAFTIFWAYIGFDQYMLIWYANIPEETSYYIVRNTGNWWFLSTLLVVCRFFLIFPILLTQWVKKHPRYLMYAAIWILLMQLLDVFIIVLAFQPANINGVGFIALFFSIFPVIGIGGILGWLFLRNLTSSYLYPTKDPRLALSLKLTN